MEEVSVRRNTAADTDMNDKVMVEREPNGTDAMMNVLPTPDNSIPRDSEDSRSSDPVSTEPPDQPMTNSASPPPSKPAELPPSQPPQSPPAANQSTSPHLPSPLQNTTPSTPTKSPPATNPWYHSYRPTTPPIASSAEASPLVSPAKRFSSGEVKQPYLPTSPLNQLTDEDRAKFTQLATQLKTRLTYAAIKVENGWEKHSFSQIKSLLNEQSSPLSTPPGAQIGGGGRRRSQTFNEGAAGKLTYETFWATHSRQNPPYTNPSTSYPTQQNSTQNSSQPSYQLPSQQTHSQPLPARGEQPPRYATFPRRKPERLSLQTGGAAHTARDQSAAEIMIALASPRTRSEFSSPERDEVVSPSPKSRRKDVDGLGIHA
jgi:Whi5 like